MMDPAVSHGWQGVHESPRAREGQGQAGVWGKLCGSQVKGTWKQGDQGDLVAAVTRAARRGEAGAESNS